jgi:hypothetical protein
MFGGHGQMEEADKQPAHHVSQSLLVFQMPVVFVL